jgi:hypothetical protein
VGLGVGVGSVRGTRGWRDMDGWAMSIGSWGDGGGGARRHADVG